MALRRLDVKKLRETEATPVSWLAKGFIAKGAVTLMYGEPGCGKSALALGLAAGVAEGTHVPGLGLPCVKGNPVLIDAENGENELQRRIKGMSLNFNVEVFEATAFSLTVNGLSEIEEELIKIGPTDLIILDSLRTLWPDGDENSSGPVTAVMTRIQQLARNFDTSIMILHHSAKGGGFRGSGAMTAVPEIAIEMGRWKNDKVEDRRFIKWDKCRMASSPKQKWITVQADTSGDINMQMSHAPKESELWPRPY